MKFRPVARQAVPAAKSTSRRKTSSSKSLDRKKRKKKDDDGISKSSSNENKFSKRKREPDGEVVIQRPAGKRRTSFFVGAGSRISRRRLRKEEEEEIDDEGDEERTVAMSPASSVGSSVSSMTPLTTVTNNEQAKKPLAKPSHRGDGFNNNEQKATPPPPSTVKVRFEDGSGCGLSPKAAPSSPSQDMSPPKRADTDLDQATQSVGVATEKEDSRSIVAINESMDRKFEYPCDDDVDFPSATTLRQLHDHHISPFASGKEQESHPTEALDQMITLTVPTEDQTNARSHQLSLTLRSSRLLSLEDVLIPAIAYTEQTTLKRLQATALSSVQQQQLDPAQRTSLARLKLTSLAPVALSRMAIQECALAACMAARQSRLARDAERHKEALETKQRRDDQRAQRRKLEAERRRQEQQRQYEHDREVRRMLLRKTLPKNKRAQKEIVHLFTQLAHMEKAERVWTQTLAQVEADTKKRTGDAETIVKEIQAKPPIQPESEQDSDKDEKSLDYLLDSLVVALDRIESSLKHVSNVVIPQSDAVRIDLYQTYTQHHKFQGYRNRLGGKRATLSAATLFKRALRDIESDDATDSTPTVVGQEGKDDGQDVANEARESVSGLC